MPKKWQLSTGMGGNFGPESMATFKRNRWQLCSGICIYQAGNNDLIKSIEIYAELLLKNEMKFGSFTSKQLVDEARKIQAPENQKWL